MQAHLRLALGPGPAAYERQPARAEPEGRRVARRLRFTLLLVAVVCIYALSDWIYALALPIGWLEHPLGQGFGAALRARVTPYFWRCGGSLLGFLLLPNAVTPLTLALGEVLI